MLNKRTVETAIAPCVFVLFIYVSNSTFRVLGELCVDKFPLPVDQRPVVRWFLHMRLVLLGKKGEIKKCLAINRKYLHVPPNEAHKAD